MKKLILKRLLMCAVFTFGFASIISGCTNSKTSEQYVAMENQNPVQMNNSTSNTVSAITTDSKQAMFSQSDLFTDRDLEQTADLTNAKYYTVSDGENITITSEGVYVLQGIAKNVTVYVEADKEAKVQIVLDGVSITNTDSPCIYVKQADKVFVTTTDSENTLEVTDEFVDDGETNTNGVIFSKEDITLNGVGTLTINSTKNGLVGKDDLKITGGTYNITASKKTIDANDSIRILDGTFVLNAGTDGLHAENSDDDSMGYIYIGGGDFTINAGDDAIHGTSIVQIDNGNFVITGGEGIEGTLIQVNGGNIDITATDDGINAASKSDSYEVSFTINDGYIKIVMGAGDTDGIDSNGNLYIYGGTLDIEARSPTDYDGVVVFEGGKLIIDGEEYDTVPNQMMGGGGRGGMGGGMGPRGGEMRGDMGEIPQGMGSGDMRGMPNGEKRGHGNWNSQEMQVTN